MVIQAAQSYAIWTGTKASWYFGDGYVEQHANHWNDLFC